LHLERNECGRTGFIALKLMAARENILFLFQLQETKISTSFLFHTRKIIMQTKQLYNKQYDIY